MGHLTIASGVEWTINPGQIIKMGAADFLNVFGTLSAVGTPELPSVFVEPTVYVALPLVAGYVSRRWLIATKGEVWFRDKFLHFLTPIPITALLVTLVLLFSFKGETIVENSLTILWIAIP